MPICKQNVKTKWKPKPNKDKKCVEKIEEVIVEGYLEYHLICNRLCGITYYYIITIT